MQGNSNNSSGRRSVRAIHFSAADVAALESSASLAGYPTVSEYLLHLHQATQPQRPSDARPDSPAASKQPPRLEMRTSLGEMYCGDSAELMRKGIADHTVDLIMTSPPFGLVRKKDYGNEDADRYVAWFHQFAAQFVRILKPSGSLVIDIGGAWKQGQPTRSLYHYELLIMLCRDYHFHLAQEFFWWNPAKLPSPAEWVNIRRVRVKDAVNCVWWLSPTPYPRATNRRVLQPYSPSMLHLLKHGYNRGRRPSGHDISDKFGQDNGGAIPPNLIAIANTESNTRYQRYCRDHGIPEHPARFPAGLPAFFIRMLTDPRDLVFDPFAGSAVTGAVAESLNRRWISCEIEPSYIDGAKGRFCNGNVDGAECYMGDKKREPYLIHPPALTIPDADAPLVADGGKNRPGKGP